MAAIQEILCRADSNYLLLEEESILILIQTTHSTIEIAMKILKFLKLHQRLKRTKMLLMNLNKKVLKMSVSAEVDKLQEE
jgi:hypothetical protein